MANDLSSKTQIDGLYINDPLISDWSFLEKIQGVSRYIFGEACPAPDKEGVLDPVKHATELAVDLSKVRVDLSQFARLETLFTTWWPGIEFGGLPALRRLQLFKVRKSKGDFVVDLPDSINWFEVVNSSFGSISLRGSLPLLRRLGFFYIRNLVSIEGFLQGCENLVRLELQNVNGVIDYSCLANLGKLESLFVEKCPEIKGWEFMRDLHLRDLMIVKTKCPDLALAPAIFNSIENLYVPKG